MASPRVVVVQKSLPRYRVLFFERLRERLDTDGIELSLVHGNPTPGDTHRNDAAEMDWAIRRANRVVRIGRRELVWQACLQDVRGADLVIAEQASRLLVNYLLLARQTAGKARVAFWGHGANLQVHSASAVSESLKRRLSRRPHWWFAYTDGTRRRIEALGYPAERITVVQNAQDTEQLATAVAAVPDEERRRFRQAHDLGDGPVGLFLGSLTKEKRLGFLLDACERIATREPGFRLLVAGDGEERARVRAAAARHEWLRPLGRVNGLEDRAVVLAVADAMLVPGAVGLVALDSFAAGVPLVTTAAESHGPEIEYVRHDVNGAIAPRPDDADAYAALALDTMKDGAFRRRLLDGCRAARQVFTLEAMVERFAGGVREALAR